MNSSGQGVNADGKLLLMGPSGGGKTCMRSVIFENYLPRDAFRQGLSVGITDNKVRILNNLMLSLWDCGGQREYVKNYLTKQKEYIFRNVSLMLFVFDVLHLSVQDGSTTSSLSLSVAGGAAGSGAKIPTAASSAATDLLATGSASNNAPNNAKAGGSGHLPGTTPPNEPPGLAGSGAGIFSPAAAQQTLSDWTKEEMMDYFVTAMTFLREHSPQAQTYILLHKVDTISDEHRSNILEQRKNEIVSRLAAHHFPESFVSGITFFGTSLWSNSLYHAYSTIIRGFVPHRSLLVNELKKVHRACQASDVALYERNTLLTLAHINENGEVDAADSEERTAKLAEIVKSFKLSCLQSGTSFADLRIRLPEEHGTVLLSRFTDCTMLLTVCKDPQVNVELHDLNGTFIRKGFQKFLSGGDTVAQALRDTL